MSTKGWYNKQISRLFGPKVGREHEECRVKHEK